MRKIRLLILLFVCCGLALAQRYDGLQALSSALLFPVFDALKGVQGESPADTAQHTTDSHSSNTPMLSATRKNKHAIGRSFEHDSGEKEGVNLDTLALSRKLYTGLHGISFDCQRANRGTIERSKTTKLYKWVDDKGKTHFGDRAPTQQAAQTIEYQGGLNYFDLIIHADSSSLSTGFKDELSTGITKSYEVLADLLPAAMLKKVAVNVWLFDTGKDYRAFRRQYAPSLKGKNVGFHNALYNISAVHATNKVSAMKTSIHESVHVIIGGIFGHIPRWLNEGMAEYLDGMNVYGQTTEIRLKPYFLNKIVSLNISPVNLLNMTDKQWMQSSQELLYAQSWSLVYFLMSDSRERELLRSFLIESAKKPCEKLDFYDFVTRYYSGGINSFQNSYSEWLGAEITMHQY